MRAPAKEAFPWLRMAGRPVGRVVMAAEVGLEGGGAPTGLRPDAAMQRTELMPLLETALRPGESW